jgi:sialate O-acetylesterase
MRKIIFLIVLFITIGVHAQIKLPSLISDGMILQRETPITIWGWSSSNERIHVTFQNETYSTRADRNGNWSVELPKYQAGTGYTMQINDIEINDILIGDVWLCSGQSNMEITMRRLLDLYADEVKNARNPYIRQFRIAQQFNFINEETDVRGEWKSVTSENLLDFSGVAYFFAQAMYETYGVPVGLIQNAQGGTPAEAWISREGLKNFPNYIAQTDRVAVPGFIDSTRTAEQQRSRQWHSELNRKDSGINRYNEKDFDDSGWRTFSLPGYWADKGMGQVNGSLWFRKNVEIPASMAGKSGILRLGCIVDADSAFVNGVFVGSIGYQYPPRIYIIPAGVLQEGKNNVTIRVISNSGRGGFVEEKPYKIIVDNHEIDLTGDWKFKIGAEMQPAPGQTFFQYTPIGLYNGLIAPLKNYALKGVLWYQGESNTGRAENYEQLMIDLINDWRNTWKNPQMPFLYVQLTNFMRESKQPQETGWAVLRDAQRRLLQVPNTGMAVAIDVGEWNDIHPLNKKTVGQRLALEARRVAFNETDIVSQGPLYENMEIDGNSIILTFSSVGSGIYTNLDLSGFTIAGEDSNYVWANSVPIAHNKIKVWSNEIQNPVSVRYAWANNPVSANLRNKEGFPASPFTTK